MTVVGVGHFPWGPTYMEPNVAAREEKKKQWEKETEKKTQTWKMITMDEISEAKS
jgi:hypothetical protein